jgi:regulator of replication initiation timing
MSYFEGFEQQIKQEEDKLKALKKAYKAQVDIDAQLVKNNDSLREENARLRGLLEEWRKLWKANFPQDHLEDTIGSVPWLTREALGEK